MKSLKEFFDTLSLSVKEWLTDPIPYQIPDYQRPYRWTTEEVKKLWDDVFEAYEKGEENYFLGPIITAAPKKDGSSPPRDVIDGQQRLTTLVILCCVIRDKYPGTLDGILGKEFNSSILGTHGGAQNDFEKHITRQGATLKNKRPDKGILKTDEPKHKFINTACFFLEKFHGWNNDKGSATDFIKFLFGSAGVIRIDCFSTSSAHKIFQVINTTGIDLTTSELIKSFLLGKLGPWCSANNVSLPNYEKRFISDWSDMERDAKACASNMEDIFTAYAYYILAKNPEKGLYDMMAARLSDSKPNDVVGDMKEFFATCREELYNETEGGKVIYSFRYLPWRTHWKSILIATFRHCPDDSAKLAKALRRFYYLYWIGGKTLLSVKHISFTIIDMVKKGKSADDIIKEMQRKIHFDGIAAMVKINLAWSDIAREKWCKPLLLLLEHEATDDKRFIPLNKDLHLEHVLPRGYSEETEWRHISEQVAGKYLESAGNLTLLSGRKNIIASNDSFDRKIQVYRGLGGDQGMTALAITSEIVGDYDRDRYNKQWNEDSMRDRKRWFLEETEKILKIGIDPDSD